MRNRAIGIIMFGLVAWVSFHAMGAYWGGGRLEPNLWRAVIVLACGAALLAFWGLLLNSRRGRELSARRKAVDAAARDPSRR